MKRKNNQNNSGSDRISAEIIFRIAGIEDLPLLEAVGENLFDYPIKKNCAIEFFNDPRHHLAIALVKEDIVGFASAFAYLHPDKETMLFINEVAVLNQFQNQDIGRTLVRYLCRFAGEMGVKEAWIATHASNPAACRAFTAAGGRADQDLAVVINYDLDAHSF